MRVPATSISVACFALPLLLRPALIASEAGWPKLIKTEGLQLVVYQPQLESWNKNRLKARTAVTVMQRGVSTPFYGVIWIAARTDVDREHRLVYLDDLTITLGSFVVRGHQVLDLLNVLPLNASQWPSKISLDRLLADLAITDAEGETESVSVNNAPPKIIFATRPSVLIRIDGEPVYRMVPGSQYARVINTPALLLFDSRSRRFYLDGRTRWMTATDLVGRWKIEDTPAAGLDAIRSQLSRNEDKDPHEHVMEALRATNSPPEVIISTAPAELLQIADAPQFSSIGRTNLAYVTNSENDIFTDVKTHKYYTLLSGRWYTSDSLNGSWAFLASSDLPRDFSRIPPDSPKGAVLASVPGTSQAKEVIIANQVPQTARVKRKEISLEVAYDGEPRFKPIEGTMLEYGVNTSTDVIRAGTRYYGCYNAVWFTGDSPLGPWVIADYVAPEIYSIPPTSPLFHDRYVYVYNSTPDFVDFGYTPGYLGAYGSDGLVVYGTGWEHPGWAGDSYFGSPWTWGMGFTYAYWTGGWFRRPASYPWWYHNQHYLHRVYSEHWNPQWNPRDHELFQRNSNVYTRWQPDVLVPYPTQERIGAAPIARVDRPDLYAGRDGDVYEYRTNGWYQHTVNGHWNRVESPPGLESQRKARELGESRSKEFRDFSQAQGFGALPGVTRMPQTFALGFGGKSFAAAPGPR